MREFLAGKRVLNQIFEKHVYLYDVYESVLVIGISLHNKLATSARIAFRAIGPIGVDQHSVLFCIKPAVLYWLGTHGVSGSNLLHFKRKRSL